jgi:Flp pilus assembly protein TadD
LGKYDEAVKAFEKSIEIGPTNGHAWIAKGKILTELCRTSEANDAFTKAKELRRNE